MKRGGPLKRKTELRAKSPLRRYTELRSTPRVSTGTSGERSVASVIQPTKVVSAKRGPRTGHRLPVDVRALVRERSAGWCELQLPGCTGRATQVHHRVTQKAGGRHGKAAERSDRASNLLDLDDNCHWLVTNRPGRAYTYGASLRERQDSAQEPVLYRGELVYLDDEGLVHDYEKAGA